MSPFRRQLRFWSIWTLAAAILLTVNPWGQLGSVEMLAVLGPFLLAIPNRIWREATFAIGLPLLTLAWLADPSDSSVLRLLFAWAVFSVGIILAARVLESQQELESVVGLVAYQDQGDETESEAKSLRHAIERELGRARRHDRSFAVLSAAPHPRSLEADSAGHLPSEFLQSLAVNRALLELQALLRSELHLYCDASAEGLRVLALVPEIEQDALERLLERVQDTAADRLEFDVQIGAGFFPRDAVCSAELIEAADRRRTTSKLRSLSERAVPSRDATASPRRTPDVQV